MVANGGSIRNIDCCVFSAPPFEPSKCKFLISNALPPDALKTAKRHPGTSFAVVKLKVVLYPPVGSPRCGLLESNNSVCVARVKNFNPIAAVSVISEI